MQPRLRRILAELFFISGLCGLVYQVVWVRLAFAAFGVVTPVLSVVLSVFMAGIALGAWAGGRFAAPLVRRLRVSAAVLYGVVELGIAVSALAVPKGFDVARALLLDVGGSDSGAYLALSASCIA